jgi:hypothetical protein
MKTQLLRCELQTLFRVCQAFERVQNAEMAEYDPKQILYKVGNLPRILSVLCTE